MNINETLANYFEGNNPIIDGENNERIRKFLLEEVPSKKYKLAKPLIKDLVKPRSKDQLYRHIAELYEVEQATMSLTGKRDHVIHALNTFILGVYINDNYLGNKVDDFQWKLAALFHDIAYPIEISQEIIERYFKKMSKTKDEFGIENFDPSIELVPQHFEKLTNNKNAFEYIQKRIYKWGLNVNVQKRYDDMISSKICHGMISALTVLYLVDLKYQECNPQGKRQSVIVDNSDWNRKYFENDIVSACSAIFLHNLPNAFEKINKNKAPLPYLLKLCDELQNWDRPNQNKHQSDPPKNYDISTQNNRLIFKVNSEKDRDKISKKIECLNDSNISVEWVTNFKNDTSE